MIRFIISKVVQEIVKSPQNKRFFDDMPEHLKRAYADDDNDGVVNMLDKDVDPATKSEWKKGISEYSMGKGSFKDQFERSDSVYNKFEQQILMNNITTYLRNILFVVFVGYIIVNLLFR